MLQFLFRILKYTILVSFTILKQSQKLLFRSVNLNVSPSSFTTVLCSSKYFRNEGSRLHSGKM